MLIKLGRDTGLAAKARKGGKGYNRESKEPDWQRRKLRIKMRILEVWPSN
jgi:hypothetical protein